MQYRSRKLLSLLLALLMIVSLLPSAAFADEIDETPIEEVVEEVEETPVEETPVEETPVEEAPVEETPVEETPAEETPVEETPVEETPVEETPVEETLVEETPVEETPVEETLVEETPVEEAPVEETPVEEAPVEEAPVEETPVEEPEVDEAVAAVQALINALPDVSALEGLSADELVALDTQAGDAYDAYYELSEAQQAQITGLDNLLALLDYFTTLVTVEEETTTQPEGTVDFATFLSYLENGDVVNFDGSTVDEAVDGKLTVQWSPEDGEVQSNAAGNTPAKANNGNAQYIILSGKTNVTIKNVEFVYVPGDFTLTGNTGYAGSFTEEGVPNAQLYLENSGDTVIEDCSFEKVVFTSWSNTGKTEVKNCSFSDIYNSYAIKDLGGATASVTNCTFNNCGGGIMTNGNGDRSNVSTTLTISDNQFTNIDVENTAADDNVGNRGVLQFAENTTFAGLTVSDNTATNCGPILRQLSASAVNYVAANLDALEALAGESGTLYTNNTKDDHKPATPVEVDSYAALKVALADGKSVKLTADFELAPEGDAINDVVKAENVADATIDLNQHTITLVCEDLFITSNLTIQNGEIKLGTIRGTGGSGLLRVGSFSGENENLTVTLDDITINAEDYNSRYAIFSINDGNTLNIKNSNITLNNDLSVNSNNEPNGGFVKANTTSAKLNIESSEITLTNVSRAVVYTTTTVTSSTITVTGDGTDEKMEHGFNGTTLTVTNSTITMEGLHGRGFTSYNNANTLTINGASTVSFTNCGEGAIMAKEASTTITVDAASTLTADTVVCNTGYTVTVTSGEDAETIESATEAPALKVENGTVTVTEKTYVAQIGTTKYETLAAAFEAAKTGDTIELLKDVELTKGITISTGGITFDGNNHKLTGNIKNLGGWDCVVLNYETPEATAGAKITDLTIEMTAAWGIHFNGSGTTCPELNNVTVEGTYTAPFGLYLRNNGGAKLTNCNIVSMFTNSGRSSDNDKLTLDGTHIDTLFVNTTTATTTKVFVNDTGDTKSSVGALYLADDSTMRLDSSAQSLSTEENTTYSVFYNGEVKQYVAKIGNNYYFSLEKAVAAAQTSDTITLLRDVTVTETTEIPSTISNLTIEGQNHTITADKSSDANLRVFNFVNSKNPTIRNLKIIGSAYYGIELNGCGQSTLENVTVEGEYARWNDVPLALYVQNTGGASLKNCSFVGVGKNGNGLISETNDQRLKLDSTTIEKLYVNATEVVYEDVVYLAEGEEHTSKINTICCGDYSSIRVSAALCERAGSILLKSYDESVLFVSPAAKIDTVYYSTLSDAVAALKEGDTLTLLKDIEVNADNKDKNRIKLESLKGVTIDGNGKIFTVDLDGNSYCLMFTGTTDLTVKNLTVTGEVNYAIFIKSCVNTTLENVKVDTTSNGLGDDDNVYAVTFNYTGGGTLKNCEINGVFKNGEGVTANGTDGRLKLENSTIGNLYVNYTKGDGYLNKENLTAGANDKSEIENLILGYGDTSRVSYDVTKNAENIVRAVALVTYANNTTEAFFTLPKAVAAVEGQSTATITLLRDASGAGVVFENENKVGKHSNLTIDFNGFTYTVTGPSVGSTKTETNAFQILEGNTVTLKNGKLTCTATSESGCKRLIQNYANLTLEDMEFDGTKISDPDSKVYALSFCCGTVNIIGNTSITAKSDAMAFDSDQYSTYDAPVVTVNTTGTITGDVAVTGGTLNIRNGTFNGSLSKSTGTIAISGGTFATEIQDDWCAQGFEPVALSDGTYSVQVETGVKPVTIGSAGYNSLTAALDVAEDGNRIIIHANATDETVTVNKAVTIVNPGFSGYTINAGEGYTMIESTTYGVNIYSFVKDESLGYVAKIVLDDEKEVMYTTVEAAVRAAESGQTVTLVADAIEEKATLLLNEGVTLDLDTYTLKAKALFGADDSYVTGSYYSEEEDYAQLYVSTLTLDETAYYDGKHDVLPVYVPAEDGGYYAFSRFAIVDSGKDYGVKVDESQDTITFSFNQALTGDVREKLLQDNGSSDNELQIVVDVTYSDGNGSHHHNYIYIDEFVQKVASQRYYYTFTLTGYSYLNIDPETVTIQARAETTSGVTTYGNTFVNSQIVTE